MNKLFDTDSPIMRFLSKTADLIILNILTVICSIPVFTIGAAVTALYAALDKLNKDEGTLLKNYFHAFKINFLQITVQWLILLAAGALLFFGFFFYESGSLSYANVLQYVSVLLIVIWFLCLAWVFPLQAKFHVTVKGNLKNALICAFAFLPKTVVMAFLNVIPYFVFFFFPVLFFQGGFLWIFLWFALAGMLNLKLLKKPFSVISQEKDSENDHEKQE